MRLTDTAAACCGRSTMSSTQRIRDAFDRMQHVFAKRPALGCPSMRVAPMRVRLQACMVGLPSPAVWPWATASNSHAQESKRAASRSKCSLTMTTAAHRESTTPGPATCTAARWETRGGSCGVVAKRSEPRRPASQAAAAAVAPSPIPRGLFKRVRGREPQPDAGRDDERAVEHADQQEDGAWRVRLSGRWRGRRSGASAHRSSRARRRCGLARRS